MFLGIDTAFFLYLTIAQTEACLASYAQSHDSPSYAALEAAHAALHSQEIDLSSISCLAVVDFTKPSYLPRLEIYQPGQCRPARFLCAHGVNSGDVYAVHFSNRSGSNQTSLGLYRTGETYRGSWGTSLILHGLEPGINDAALQRRIVLHGAWYSAPQLIPLNIAEGLGARIGRSQGCPAVAETDLSEDLRLLQPGSYLYIHGHGRP